MNVVIAIDSFKGSLSSLEATHAIRQGILAAAPDTRITSCPLADGGEGTVEALTLGMGGRFRTVTVTGPLETPVECTYGIVDADKTAIIEMAGAAGLTLVPDSERNPMNTTTRGVGEVIKDAIANGCRRFIIGIGGSATNDGGIGMLQALGYEFSDRQGLPVSAGAKGLRDLCAISSGHVIPELADCSFCIACDVTNPLCGENGCSAVFGPQKGADSQMVRQMDGWLSEYAILTRQMRAEADASRPGAGAAGGLGFAFLSYTNAVLESGIKIVLEELSFEKQIQDADLVITGEGRLDAQTVMGKAPHGVATAAKKYNKTVIAFSGMVTEDAVRCNEKGIDAFFPILRRVTTLEEAMKRENAARNLADTAEQVFRLILAVQRKQQ